MQIWTNTQPCVVILILTACSDGGHKDALNLQRRAQCG